MIALFKPRNLLLLLAMALLGLLAAVVVSRYRPPQEVAEIVTSLPSGVDLALQDINYTHSEGGAARWRLVARQVEHRSAEKLTVIEALQLTFFDANGAEQGRITARQGEVNADFSLIAAKGEVEIVSNRGYTLRTDHLVFRQQDRTVRTDAPVTLTTARGRLDGVGLVLNLDTRRLQIPGKVRAVLAPTRGSTETR